jgi:hypothetical protein
MKTPKHPTLIRRSREARLKALRRARPFLGASLVRIARVCGNPRCRCTRGQKHVSWYLTYKEKAKTRTLYVPLASLPEVRQWIQEHRRLKSLSREISQLSLALLRAEAPRARRFPRNK